MPEPMADMCRYWIESYITWRGEAFENDRYAEANAQKCKQRAIEACGGRKKAKKRYLEILREHKLYRRGGEDD